MLRSSILGLVTLLVAALPLPTQGAWLIEASPVVAERSSFQIEFEDVNGDQKLSSAAEITYFSGVTVWTNYRSSVEYVAMPLETGLWVFGSENEGHLVAYASDWSYRVTPPLSSLPATSTPTATATHTSGPLLPTSTAIASATATRTSTRTLVFSQTPTRTATSAPPAGSIHVGPLVSYTEANNNTWLARVTITTHTASHAPLAGVLVDASWSSGTTGSASCTTNSTGKCTVTKSNLSSTIHDVILTVTNLTKTGSTYVASHNHDPFGIRIVPPSDQ